MSDNDPTPPAGPLPSAGPVPTAGPLPTASRRRWLLPLALVLLVGAAVGTYFALRSTHTPLQALVLTLPKGPPWVLGFDPKPLLAFPPAAKGLARPDVQAQITTVKSTYGVDILAATGIAGAFQVADGGLQYLLLAELPLEVEKLAGKLTQLPGAESIEVKGKALRRLPFGKTLDHYLPDVLLGQVDAPPVLPIVPDLVFGPLDDHRFIAGTPKLVEAYLAGGATIADDTELSSRLANVPANALVWGVARLVSDSAEQKLFRDLALMMPRPADQPVPPTWPDVIGSFELHFDGNTLVGIGAYDFASEADAIRSKQLLEQGFGVMKTQLGGMTLDVAVTQKGAQASVTIRFPLPIPPG